MVMLGVPCISKLSVTMLPTTKEPAPELPPNESVE